MFTFLICLHILANTVGKPIMLRTVSMYTCLQVTGTKNQLTSSKVIVPYLFGTKLQWCFSAHPVLLKVNSSTLKIIIYCLNTIEDIKMAKVVLFILMHIKSDPVHVFQLFLQTQLC